MNCCIVTRVSLNYVTLTDSKYDDEAHPDFVAPGPVHTFSLSEWLQLCMRKDTIDIGLGDGLKPGNYVTLAGTVIERLSPQEFVWNTKNGDGHVAELHFFLEEHEALLHAFANGRIVPVELGGELAPGHEVRCEPLSPEVIELNSLLEP